MIHTIEIDGFRSLLKFRMELRPGLNIIVGANGTGKSNFITFLDFLSTLIENGLNSAIAVAQGAGAIFSKELFLPADGPRPSKIRVSFQVCGTIDAKADSEALIFTRVREGFSEVTGTYVYECEITYDAVAPAVYISFEKLVVHSNLFNDLRIFRTTKESTGGFETTFEFQPSTHPKLNELFEYPRERLKQSPSEFLENRVAPERSMLTYLSHEAPEFACVLGDLTSYRSVNIDPRLARKPTLVSSYTKLEATGEGLAGALYEIKKGTYFPNRFYRPRVATARVERSVFESIMSWCREVNPAIVEAEVTLDFDEAQFLPQMVFQHGSMREKFSFSRISDGTVKWLALVTVLFAEPSLSMIEEPENFLHPQMQESFVNLCRQAIEDNPGRCILVSTHSPTLLDCCSPKELTLFELDNGRTVAAQVGDRDDLEKKLVNARFGLGHYYRIGALRGEDSSDC